jgi:putative DNA primase/helicase
MRVLRFDQPGGQKQYRPVHPVGDGGWRIGDPPAPLPLYHLNQLPASGTVYVCEGEKAADMAWQVGLPATTSAHGSSSAAKTDWSPLAGFDVVVLPDNDDAGERYADDVVRMVTVLEPPARVRVVRLPGLPHGGDLVEFAQARADPELAEVASEVMRLAEAAPVATAKPATAGDESDGQSWPDPQPLPAGLPPVPAFDYELLPASLRPWVADAAERMQCPPDYCAATVVVLAGMLIGRKVLVRPKQRDDWQVAPNLYGMMIGRPSLMKTPAMREMLKFANRLEVEAKEAYQQAMAEREAAALVSDAKQKVKKEQLKKAVRDGADADAIAAELARGEDQPPVRARYVVNDTTVEKLGVILSENPNGILLFADELAGFLRSMDREGHEADRSFYLTAWEGLGRHTYDRIGRGTVDIEAAIVSIVGSIQPGVLSDYLHGAVQGGRGDDGLVQRFQLAVWPDVHRHWRLVDRYPNPEARATAHAALQRLADLTPLLAGAARDGYERDDLPYLRFDHYAQQRFNDWWTDLENRIRRGDEHQAIESHLAKYRSLVPSLALILHLLDGGVGPINDAAVERSVAWSTYLEAHAKRMYAGVIDAPATASRLLAKRILDGSSGPAFAARDVYRQGWSGLDRERTEVAIDVLLSLGWLDERTEPTAGRTRTRYVVNPKAYQLTLDEPTEPTEDPSGGSVGDVPEEF